MEGYPVELSFFIEGQRTFNTVGMANNVFYDSLSAPMVITTSCLENLIIPSTEIWFGMIIKDTECQFDIAVQNIINLGASVAFYYDKNWSQDIFSMKNKNIAIDNVTYGIVEKNSIIQTGIQSNGIFVQGPSGILFVVSVSCIMFGFVLYRMVVWTYNKIKTYNKNKKYLKTSAYSGDGGESCTICIEEFSPGEIVRTLQCKHIFHKTCIDEWFEKKEVCPNCNQPALTEPLLH
jgi:hypothetical protein